MKKLLIIGLGDIARRALPLLGQWDVIAPNRAAFDLDHPDFAVLPRQIDALFYTVAPLAGQMTDVRLAHLLAFWRAQHIAPKHIVYISTSGVYGDCTGQWVDERRALAPISPRGALRVNAEQQLQTFAQHMNVSLTILRAPGIYALERLPLQRLRDKTPILLESEDGYSNHIHADDLANMCAAALKQPQGTQIYNACDDVPLKMGDWFCALAGATGLEPPERVRKAALMAQVSAMQWGFVRESRQLANGKIKQGLGVKLRYPSVLDFLAEHQQVLSKLALAKVDLSTQIPLR
jgi:nucleoside-diphosphate-sugar epimerase